MERGPPAKYTWHFVGSHTLKNVIILRAAKAFRAVDTAIAIPIEEDNRQSDSEQIEVAFIPRAGIGLLCCPGKKVVLTDASSLEDALERFFGPEGKELTHESEHNHDHETSDYGP